MKPWPRLDVAFSDLRVPEGITLRLLRESEIPELVAALASWFPDIVVGSESRHLREEFYRREATLEGSGGDRPVLAVTAWAGGRLVALVTFEKDVDARTLTSPMAAVAPDHRGTGLGLLGYPMLERIGRAIEAELLLVYVTLKAPHEQKLAERSGFQLVGILPGYDRDMIRPGEVRRVYEAVYTKSLAPEAVEEPSMDALTPATRALFDVLFRSARGGP